MATLLRFPIPLRIGTDICQISRIQTILAGPNSVRFVRRILAMEECMNTPVSPFIKPAQSSTAPPILDQTELQKAAVFLAGRFAAKEATFKSHSKPLGFHDVIIKKEESGRPIAIIKGTGNGLDQEALISISHDGDYATAVCLGFEPQRITEVN